MNIQKIEKIENNRKRLLKLFLSASLVLSVLTGCNSNKKTPKFTMETTLNEIIDTGADFSKLDEILANPNFISKAGNYNELIEYYKKNIEEFATYSYFEKVPDFSVINNCNDAISKLAMCLVKAKVVEATGIDPTKIIDIKLLPNGEYTINGTKTICKITLSKKVEQQITGGFSISVDDSYEKVYDLGEIDVMSFVVHKMQNEGVFTNIDDFKSSYIKIMDFACMKGKNTKGEKITFSYNDEIVDAINHKYDEAQNNNKKKTK